MKIGLVVMVLNEEERLPTFLASLAAQTRLPDRVLLLDDGSSDGSPEIIEEFAARHPWASVECRPPRPLERDRLASASVWASFQAGVAKLREGGEVDVVAKVDADLQLTPRLLEEIEAHFEADPTLGLTGPYLSERQPDGSRKRLRWRPEHVGGAVKFYRRECYDQVCPLAPLPNFDMVDEVKARSRGWRTASFEARDGDSLHLRPHGTYDGPLRGFRRWGMNDYVSGSHPLLVLYVGLQRARERPLLLGALNYWAGWAVAALRRVPRFDAELRELRRREQLARLRVRVSGTTARLRTAGTRQERSPGRAGK